MDTAYLTTTEAARRLGISACTVRRAVRRGQLTPALQTPGGYWRFRADDVDAYARQLAAGAQETPAAPDYPGSPSTGTRTASVVAAAEQVRAIYDATACGIVVQDAVGTIIYANAAAETILGLSADQMRGRTSFDPRWRATREDGTDFPGAEHPTMVALRTQRPVRNVTMGVCLPTGERHWIQVDAVPLCADGMVRVVACFTDITARRQAEEALRQSEESFRLLFAGNPHPMWVYDLHTLAFLEVNDAAVATYGYTRDEFLALRITDIRPADEVPRLLNDVRQERPALQHSREWRHRLRDGRLIDVEVTSHTLTFAGRAAVLTVAYDITERKRDEALRRATEAAEHANRAKDEFLSRMSHELRTPLNAILGFAQVLEMTTLTPHQEQGVAHILKGGRHLLALINEVLDITRIASNRLALSLEPVCVRTVQSESLELMAPLAAQRDVRLLPRPLARNDWHVRADQQRLKQVLLNLLSNAVKYNRRGGTVTLSCTDTGAGQLRLALSDTGAGIPRAQLGRLFIPFERLNPENTEVEGTGLGLALSKSLVEAMNGTIGVDSVVGTGSTFWVELPRAEAPASGSESRDGAPLAPPQGAPVAATVLYIEDNLSNLRLIETILLEQPAIALQTAMQGRLGLELAVEHQPDLILLDLNLPDMAGEAVLRQLRDDGRTRGIPVVVVSADATPGQIARLRAAGANAYLTKPLDVRAFWRTLHEWLLAKAS